eukprot:RCo051791
MAEDSLLSSWKEATTSFNEILSPTSVVEALQKQLEDEGLMGLDLLSIFTNPDLVHRSVVGNLINSEKSGLKGNLEVLSRVAKAVVAVLQLKAEQLTLVAKKNENFASKYREQVAKLETQLDRKEEDLFAVEAQLTSLKNDVMTKMPNGQDMISMFSVLEGNFSVRMNELMERSLGLAADNRRLKDQVHVLKDKLDSTNLYTERLERQSLVERLKLVHLQSAVGKLRSGLSELRSEVMRLEDELPSLTTVAEKAMLSVVQWLYVQAPKGVPFSEAAGRRASRAVLAGPRRSSVFPSGSPTLRRPSMFPSESPTLRRQSMFPANSESPVTRRQSVWSTVGAGSPTTNGPRRPSLFPSGSGSLSTFSFGAKPGVLSPPLPDSGRGPTAVKFAAPNTRQGSGSSGTAPAFTRSVTFANLDAGPQTAHAADSPGPPTSPSPAPSDLAELAAVPALHEGRPSLELAGPSPSPGITAAPTIFVDPPRFSPSSKTAPTTSATAPSSVSVTLHQEASDPTPNPVVSIVCPAVPAAPSSPCAAPQPSLPTPAPSTGLPGGSAPRAPTRSQGCQTEPPLALPPAAEAAHSHGGSPGAGTSTKASLAADLLNFHSTFWATGEEPDMLRRNAPRPTFFSLHKFTIPPINADNLSGTSLRLTSQIREYARLMNATFAAMPFHGDAIPTGAPPPLPAPAP